MSLALPFLVGALVALLFGGRPSALAESRFRGIGLIYVAFAFQVAAFPYSWLPWTTSDGTAVALWIASDAILVAAMLLNVRLRGVALVALGLCLNLVAILANGGHMPALPSALRDAGLHYQVAMNSKEMAHPALPWLVDRWAAPHWIPMSNVFSAGDVVIAVGGFVLALTVMRARIPRAFRALLSST
jgi:Family of unknown function (DUF5317)